MWKNKCNYIRFSRLKQNCARIEKISSVFKNSEFYSPCVYASYNSLRINDYYFYELDVCVTVHHQYNDVNNQQDATTFSFINFFKSAQHVSGEKFAHPQEHFLTVYTAFGTMHRHCCRRVHCTNSCIYSQKVLLRMGEFVARNMQG